MKSNLNLNNLHIYKHACHMPDASWLIYRMQTKITLLEGLHYLIWHLAGNHITLCLVLAHSCITLLLQCRS